MNRAGTSLLTPMLNLDCHAGHRWYSPNPNKWRGHHCGTPLGNSQLCRLPLRRMRSQRETRSEA